MIAVKVLKEEISEILKKNNIPAEVCYNGEEQKLFLRIAHISPMEGSLLSLEYLNKIDRVLQKVKLRITSIHIPKISLDVAETHVCDQKEVNLLMIAQTEVDLLLTKL